jgi:hypothetical protein
LSGIVERRRCGEILQFLIIEVERDQFRRPPTAHYPVAVSSQRFREKPRVARIAAARIIDATRAATAGRNSRSTRSTRTACPTRTAKSAHDMSPLSGIQHRIHCFFYLAGNPA